MPDERATLEELLKFANKIREAGGGNPIDALMPATPADASQCLIAKNLNFNCEVDGSADDGETWVMAINDEGIRDAIADKMGLERYEFNNSELLPEFRRWGIRLPERIGNVAAAFDDYSEAARSIERRQRNGFPPFAEDLDVVRTFQPYVTESYREARQIGTLNERGELVL